MVLFSSILLLFILTVLSTKLCVFLYQTHAYNFETTIHILAQETEIKTGIIIKDENDVIKTSDGSTKGPPLAPPYPHGIIETVTTPKVIQSVRKVFASGNARLPTMTFPAGWAFTMGLDLDKERHYGAHESTNSMVVAKFDEAKKRIIIEKLDVPELKSE